MSKIFEALRKSDGEMAKLALPVVDGGDVVTAADVPPVSSLTPRAAEPAMAAHADPPETVWRETPAASAGDVRILPVRIRTDAPILPFQPGHSREGEQYRIARTKVIHHPSQPRLVVVSSAGSGDGKTVTAINLAGALALGADTQVILVEGDLRRSGIAKLLGLPEQPGMGEYLSGKCGLEDIIIRIEQFPNLSVVLAGKDSANPVELLESPRFPAVCREFRQRYKFVVFDAPPMDTVADYDLIAHQCDGVVMVVRPDRTDRKLCLEGLANVPKGKLIGVLMNCVSDWFLWKTNDYYPGTAVTQHR